MIQDINYDSVVTKPCLDLASYEKKFSDWDNVIKDGSFARGDKNAVNLLKDLTIYSYAFFKNKVDNTPYRMTSYQDAIAGCLNNYKFDPLSKDRFAIFRASNQIGKSELLALYAINKLFTGKNVNVVIVSNNLMNSQRVLRDIKFLLNTSKFSGWKESIGDTDNTTMLSVERDGGKIVNRIICAPSGEGLLGYPVHYLLLDEADFYEEAKNFFWKVAFPRTNQTKGQIVLFSNPNPDISKANSLLWELWKGDLFCRKFHFTFMDAPWNSEEEYIVAKRNSPSHIFSSTHDGEFNDLSGAFFTQSELDDMLVKDWQNKQFFTDKPVFISADLGKMKDNTVICVGVVNDSTNEHDKYRDLEVRYVEKLPLKTSYDKIAERLGELKAWYEENCSGVAAIGFDGTGQKTFGDFLKRMNIPAIDVDFAKKDSNKTLLYNNFKLMVENRKIKCVYGVDIEKQLSGLEVKSSAANNIMIVENKTGDIHDDIPDSLAILIHISVRPSSVPVTMRIISKKKDDSSPHSDIIRKNNLFGRMSPSERRTYNEFSMNF